MIREIENIILSKWEKFEPITGRKPSRLNFVIQSGLFHRIQGVLFFIFKDGEKKPFCVFKLANDPDVNDLFKHEFDSIQHFLKVADPVINGSLPRLYLDTIVNRRFGFIMEWVESRNLSNIFLNWNKKEARLEKILEWLVRFQKDTNVEYMQIDKEFLDRNVFNKCYRYRESYPERAKTEEEILLSLEKKSGEIEGLRLPVVSVHGDFCNQNILFQRQGVKIIDWMFSEKKGMFYEDLFMFTLTSHGRNNFDKRSEITSWNLVEEIFSSWGVPLSCMEMLMRVFLLKMCIREIDWYRGSQKFDNVWRSKMIKLYNDGQLRF